jgi:hypothetical protein
MAVFLAKLLKFRIIILMLKSFTLWVVTSLTIIMFTLGVNQVSAQSNQCRDLPDTKWHEIRSKYFTMIYPEVYIGTADEGFQFHSSRLDNQFELLSRAFKEELELPIMIRIYPSKDHFSCLNLYENEIMTELGFSHIGVREISLVITTLPLDAMMEGDYFVNGIIGQLSQLFAVRLTDERAPKGLLIGISSYFENQKNQPPTFSSEPIHTWRRIWESIPDNINETVKFNTQSIVAYLIDVYEWPNFVIFLNNISTSESYTDALSITYKKDFSELQEEWEDYYEIFGKSRWPINAVYNYSLLVIEESIKIGAYSEARQKMSEIQPFLEETEQTNLLIKINSLMKTATKGEEAGLLVKQSRQALQSGDYSICIELSDQALTLYKELEDQRRIGELQEYKEIAKQVLDLQAQLENLEKNISSYSYEETQLQLNSLANQFDYFGDNENFEKTKRLMYEQKQTHLNENQKPLKSVGIGVLIIFLLRMLIVFIRRPAEVL